MLKTFNFTRKVLNPIYAALWGLGFHGIPTGAIRTFHASGVVVRS